MIAVSLTTRVGDLEERMDEHDEHHVRLEAKIDDLVQDVKGLKTDLCDFKADFRDLKADMREFRGNIKADVSDLKADVSGLKTDVSDLKTDVSELKAGQLQIQHTLAGHTELMNKVHRLLAKAEGVEVTDS